MLTIIDEKYKLIVKQINKLKACWKTIEFMKVLISYHALFLRSRAVIY